MRRAARAGESRGPDREVRADIQALRALAVSAVVVYHLWPRSLTGGFVGVDVFFVISGFLITSHLLASPPTTPRGLLTFWSRRIRRLLPASLLVLLVTLFASWLLAPQTQWANIAAQVKAAALYVVNWRLANDSVDYLAAQNAATPVQHFWSLSVEEQFYLGWPVLILLLTLVAGRRAVRRAVVTTAGLAIVVAASLWYSISYTASEPARAYFVTPTRIWELGVGGLLAALLSRKAFGRARGSEALPLPAVARTGLVWLGLGAIAWTCVTYTGSTPFPSWRAGLPVLGTVAVIAAMAPHGPLSPARLFAWKPVQWLGDVSYSVYLWHWPLIVLVPDATDRNLGQVDKLAIIVGSLVLAGLTKRLVEDRFRTARWGVPLVKPYALGALGMAIVVATALTQLADVHHRQAEDRTALHSLVDAHAHDPCFGAAAMAAPPGTCPAVTSGPLAPDPLAAASDRSDAYSDQGKHHDCFAYSPSFPFKTCVRGDPHGNVRIALFGNSHAAEWLPALERIADARHWQITTYLISNCAAADVSQVFGQASAATNCLTWLQQAEDAIVGGHFDLVVYTNRVAVPAVGHKNLAESRSIYQDGYQQVLQRIATSGSPIVVIHDTPYPGRSVPDCLSKNTGDYAVCGGPRDSWLPNDPAMDAVTALDNPRITTVDLTRYVCPATTCPAVIGDVPVYFDQSHMSATFAATLAPYLQPALVRALS